MTLLSLTNRKYKAQLILLTPLEIIINRVFMILTSYIKSTRSNSIFNRNPSLVNLLASRRILALASIDILFVVCPQKLHLLHKLACMQNRHKRFLSHRMVFLSPGQTTAFLTVTLSTSSTEPMTHKYGNWGTKQLRIEKMFQETTLEIKFCTFW